MTKSALITGVTGMDGSLLAEYLISLGYKVFGFVRRSATPNNWRIEGLLENPNFKLIEGELTAQDSIYRAIQQAQPELVFNLGAQSFVPYSWTAPLTTFEVNANGVINVLEAIRNIDKSIKFYQASSSEMFGKVIETPQSEKTPYYPRSPYAASKVAAHYVAVNYRESFGIHATDGILFNHEHERRGKEFVTRKITSGVAKYFADKINGKNPTPISLGNIDARRDWGYAEDYIKGMYKIITHKVPNTYVLATGVTRSVRDFCEATVEAVKLNLDLPHADFEWKGEGVNEVGYFNGEVLFKISPDFYRPAEVDLLLGDASKAKRELGWEPETSFETMVERMFKFDFAALNTQVLELV